MRRKSSQSVAEGGPEDVCSQLRRFNQLPAQTDRPLDDLRACIPILLRAGFLRQHGAADSQGFLVRGGKAQVTVGAWLGALIPAVKACSLRACPALNLSTDATLLHAEMCELCEQLRLARGRFPAAFEGRCLCLSNRLDAAAVVFAHPHPHAGEPGDRISITQAADIAECSERTIKRRIAEGLLMRFADGKLSAAEVREKRVGLRRNATRKKSR